MTEPRRFKQPVEIYLPAAETGPPRSGQRHKVRQMPGTPLRWPAGRHKGVMKERKELFDTWHEIAMQVAHEERTGFRFLAVISRWVNWQTGTLWPTNATIAAYAGRCSSKTIQREIERLNTAGAIVVNEVSDRQSGGTKRIITLAYPAGRTVKVMS